MVASEPERNPLGRAAVFLDRDGVLNRAIVRNNRPYPPSSLDELEVIEGVEESSKLLRSSGLLLIVITNQPDIARGKTAPSFIDRINGELQKRLSLDDVMVCPHDDADGCLCRKPKPGMLLIAAARHRIDLGRSVMVGDRWRDIAAGQAAGCRTVFIDYGYDEVRPDRPDHVANSLSASVPFILAATQYSKGVG
jgi:D-glycero-D-manno-heptose 1,7-bisphosphate phosphatase